MDGYDIFRKLSTGAKFDFKRFRSDAEKLHIIRPSSHTSKVKENSNKNVYEKKKTNSDLPVAERIKDEEGGDSDTSSESDSDTEQIQGTVTNQTGDFFDKDDEKIDNDDDDDDDDDDGGGDEEESSNDSESETELNILGEIKSSGDLNDKIRVKEERKRRKLERKKSDNNHAVLKQEKINLIRKKHHVHVYGTDIPEPVESFDALKEKYNIHKHIIRNIESVGYKTPTPIQLQAIPVMLNNRDILACAPTGSGKTAAFILPVLHQLKEPRNEGVRGLVLAPTRELAKQIYREFQRLSEGMGFRLAYVDKAGKDFEKIKKTFKKTDIIVSTPNRLVFLLEQTPPLISLTSVKWLIVDESDKLFEEGKTGFRDQLATIYKSCDGSVRRAMFSATFAHDVEQWCKLHLDNVVQVYIGAKNTATKTVEQSLLFCGSEHGKLLAMRGIIKDGIEPPVLVFVQSKDRAKELFHELIYDGMNVDVIHSERSQTQRDNVVKCFRSGKIWILICTELMGRGIDFKGVNLVINYDFPNSAISYIHRIGRTGRAGRLGKAITFFTENDAVFLRSIAGVMKSAGCPVPDFMLKINKPSKQKRKMLAKSYIDRDTISTQTENNIQKKYRQKGDKLTKWRQGKVGVNPKKFKRKDTDSEDQNNPKKRKMDGDQYQGGKPEGKPKVHRQFEKPKQFNKKKGSFKDKLKKQST